MTDSKVSKRRKRSRKARTEASPSSSSDNESKPNSPESQNHDREEEQDTQAHLASPDENEAQPSTTSPVEAPSPVPHQPISNESSDHLTPEQAFDDFYLRQVTKEFSNDLDKLRSAGDFNERMVPILIEALRQGRACFTREERRVIVGDAAKGMGKG